MVIHPYLRTKGWVLFFLIDGVGFPCCSICRSDFLLLLPMNRKSLWNLVGCGGLSPGSFTLGSTESRLNFSEKFMWVWGAGQMSRRGCFTLEC